MEECYTENGFVYLISYQKKSMNLKITDGEELLEMSIELKDTPLLCFVKKKRLIMIDNFSVYVYKILIKNKKIELSFECKQQISNERHDDIQISISNDLETLFFLDSRQNKVFSYTIKSEDNKALIQLNYGTPLDDDCKIVFERKLETKFDIINKQGPKESYLFCFIDQTLNTPFMAMISLNKRGKQLKLYLESIFPIENKNLFTNLFISKDLIWMMERTIDSFDLAYCIACNYNTSLEACKQCDNSDFIIKRKKERLTSASLNLECKTDVLYPLLKEYNNSLSKELFLLRICFLKKTDSVFKMNKPLTKVGVYFTDSSFICINNKSGRWCLEFQLTDIRKPDEVICISPMAYLFKWENNLIGTFFTNTKQLKFIENQYQKRVKTFNGLFDDKQIVIKQREGFNCFNLQLYQNKTNTDNETILLNELYGLNRFIGKYNLTVIKNEREVVELFSSEGYSIIYKIKDNKIEVAIKEIDRTANHISCCLEYDKENVNKIITEEEGVLSSVSLGFSLFLIKTVDKVDYTLIDFSLNTVRQLTAIKCFDIREISRLTISNNNTTLLILLINDNNFSLKLYCIYLQENKLIHSVCQPIAYSNLEQFKLLNYDKGGNLKR